MLMAIVHDMMISPYHCSLYILRRGGYKKVI
jgi:hypothetical protein